jgi:hypothetical protein
MEVMLALALAIGGAVPLLGLAAATTWRARNAHYAPPPLPSVLEAAPTPLEQATPSALEDATPSAHVGRSLEWLGETYIPSGMASRDPSRQRPAQVCPACGALTHEGTLHCRRCGARLDDRASPG